MKFLRTILLLTGAGVLPLVVGAFASSVYRRARYPEVQDTDGLYDIGFVFILGFGVTLAAELVAAGLLFILNRRRKA